MSQRFGLEFTSNEKWSPEDLVEGFSLEVIDFTGEEGVSKPNNYKLHVAVYHQDPGNADSEDLSELVDKFVNKVYSSELKFTYSNDSNLFGVIGDSKTVIGYASNIEVSLFKANNLNTGLYVIFEIEISSFINLLSENKRTRLFKNITLGQIIEEVLANYEKFENVSNLSNSATYINDLTSGYSDIIIEYLFQYNESDLNFLTRILDKNNLFYFVANIKNGDEVHEKINILRYDYSENDDTKFKELVGGVSNIAQTNSKYYSSSNMSVPMPQEVVVKVNNPKYGDQKIALTDANVINLVGDIDFYDQRNLEWNYRKAVQDKRNDAPGLISMDGEGKIVIEDDFYNNLIFNEEHKKLHRLLEFATANAARIVSSKQKILYTSNYLLASIFDTFNIKTELLGNTRNEYSYVTNLKVQGGLVDRNKRNKWRANSVNNFFDDAELIEASNGGGIACKCQFKLDLDKAKASGVSNSTVASGYMPDINYSDIKTSGIIMGYINAKTVDDNIKTADWQNPQVSSYEDGTYDVVLQGFEVISDEKLKKVVFDSDNSNDEKGIKSYDKIDSKLSIRLKRKVDFMSSKINPNFGMDFALFNGTQVFIEFSGKNLSLPYIAGTTDYNVLGYYPSVIERALDSKVADSGQLANLSYRAGFFSLTNLYFNASLFIRLKEISQIDDSGKITILESDKTNELFPVNPINENDLNKIVEILDDYNDLDSQKLNQFVQNNNSATRTGQATAAEIVAFLKYIERDDFRLYKDEIELIISDDSNNKIKISDVHQFLKANYKNSNITNLNKIIKLFKQRDITNIVDPSTDNDNTNDHDAWFSRGFSTINPLHVMASDGGQKLLFDNTRERTSVALRSSFVELDLMDDLVPQKQSNNVNNVKVYANNAVIYSGGSSSSNFIKKEIYNVYQKFTLGGSSENWLDYATKQFPAYARNILGYLEPVANTVLEQYFAFPSDPHTYMYDSDSSYRMSAGTDLGIKEYDWSGNYILKRNLSEQFHYLDGNTYTWRINNDIYAKGPSSTSYFPGRYNADGTQDVRMSTLEEEDASLAMLIDVNGSFSAHRLISEKIYVDEHKMVLGDQGTIVKGKNNTEIYGSHHIKIGSGGAFLGVHSGYRGEDDKYVDGFKGTVTGDININATILNEVNFSGMQELVFAGNFVEMMGAEIGLYADDRITLASLITNISLFTSLFAPLGGLNNYTAPMYNIVTGSSVKRTSYTTQHAVFESLGFLVNIISMVATIVTVATATLVGGVGAIAGGVKRALNTASCRN